MRAQFRIGLTPEEAARADYLPYVLTPSERTQAAFAAVHLQQHRRELNRRDDAHALAGVLWMEDRS